MDAELVREVPRFEPIEGPGDRQISRIYRLRGSNYPRWIRCRATHWLSDEGPPLSLPLPLILIREKLHDWRLHLSVLAARALREHLTGDILGRVIALAFWAD